MYISWTSYLFLDLGSELRFDKGVDLWLESVELFENVDLWSDLFDFLVNVVQLRVSIVVLRDEVFVVDIFIFLLSCLFGVLRPFLIVCAHYILCFISED